MAKKPEREIERWVTWHGRRIPIYKGESKAEVAERMKASFKQGAEKGKEGRPETAKSVQDKQQKAKKASEKRHQKHLNMENKGHTPRRIENYKKAVEEETKAHEAAGKALEKSKIQGVKFNKPSQKEVKKESKFDESKAKKYKIENAPKALQSVADMMGMNKKDLSLHLTKESKAYPGPGEQYEIRDKDGDVVARISMKGQYQHGGSMEMYKWKSAADLKRIKDGKAESKQDQKWVSDFKKDFAKTRAQAEKMFRENDSEDIKDILFESGLGDHMDIDSMSTSELREKVLSLYDKKSTPSSADNTAYAYGNGHITRVPAGVKPLAHGGETYNFIAHVKGQLKPNYFKTEKEAQAFLDNAGKKNEAIDSTGFEEDLQRHKEELSKEVRGAAKTQVERFAQTEALSKTASRLQNKGITGQEAIENHLKGLSSTRRNRLAKELGVEGRGADKIKAMASKISEQQGGKGQQKIDKEDINNAKSRLETYKYQLKDVQDEIADAESIRPSLRHPDYDKNVASLKQKEANLKKWIKDDEELTAKEKQIANSKANARIREAEQQIRDIENGKSGNKQYWENEKKQAEKDLLASQTANAEKQKVERNNPTASIDPSVHDQISKLGKSAKTQATFKDADGHEIFVSVQKGKMRDYWGKATGRTTYTVNVLDRTTGQKLWYDYGLDSISRVKDDIYRVTGIPKKGKGLSKSAVAAAAKEINDISMRRNNGGAKGDDWKQVKQHLDNMPTDTIMVQYGERGSKSHYKKQADNTWELLDGSFKGEKWESRVLSNSWAGYGSSNPSVEFTTEKQIQARAEVAKSQTETKMKKAADLPNVKSNKSTLTRSGNTMYLDLDDRDMTPANIKSLEKKGWKRRGLGNGTWYFRG